MPLVGQNLSIIHHPDAGDKKADFNALEVYGVLGENIYYSPKTRPGSSGAPILNDQFKAVAMHRQRKTGNDIFEVNTTGEKREASQGVLLRDILAFIKAAETPSAKEDRSEKTLAHPKAQLEAGNKFLVAKDFPNAMEDFKTAWGQFIQLEDLAGQADALKGMGLTARGMGDLVLAQSSLEKAYDLYAKLGDKHKQSESLKSLSRVCRQMGNLLKAKGYIESALDIAQVIGNWGFTMHECAEIEEEMGDWENAEKHFREALETLEEEINDDRAWVDTQEALGRITFKLGKNEQSLRFYQDVLKTIEGSENKKQEADTLAMLAEISLKMSLLA
jgi:tetratricopeptide (TPR) repeat protein